MEKKISALVRYGIRSYIAGLVRIPIQGRFIYKINLYVVLVRGSTKQGLDSCLSIVGILARSLLLYLSSNLSSNLSRRIEFI